VVAGSAEMATFAMIGLTLLLCAAVAYWCHRVKTRRRKKADDEKTASRDPPTPIRSTPPTHAPACGTPPTQVQSSSAQHRQSHLPPPAVLPPPASPASPDLAWPDLSVDEDTTWPDLERQIGAVILEDLARTFVTDRSARVHERSPPPVPERSGALRRSESTPRRAASNPLDVLGPSPSMQRPGFVVGVEEGPPRPTPAAFMRGVQLSTPHVGLVPNLFDFDYQGPASRARTGTVTKTREETTTVPDPAPDRTSHLGGTSANVPADLLWDMALARSQNPRVNERTYR